MTIPKLAVIVLNYHRPQDTLECIASLRLSETKHFSMEIILVDNSEGLESEQILKKACPDIPLIHNPKNLGYAEGNNVGIRYALEKGADYFFILNNDCVVEKNTLDLLVQYAGQFPDTGILAPLVCRYDEHSRIDSCGTAMDWLRLRPREVKYGFRDQARLPEIIATPIIPGSALLFSKEFLKKTGMLNPDYFLIHEDADLCLRSLDAGYQNKVMTTACAYHKISQTFTAYPGWSIYYSIRNFLMLSQAHNSPGLQGVVYLGLLLISFKKLLTQVWTSAGRSRLRWFFLGVTDYFFGRTGACPHGQLQS